MDKDRREIKKHRLEFNTYCIFTEEKKEVAEIIGLIFKDYIENVKNNKK